MKVKEMAPPTVDQIQAEAEWIDEVIKTMSHRLSASDCNLRQFMHLEVCRAELQAYLSGLLYAMGYPEMLDHQSILDELNLALKEVMTHPS
jgi:hypothetical protein